MDVTCNRCGTDYEFEETLVSTRGTTVKCTSCGHLFKVFRGANQEHTPTDDSRPWLVRRRNGDVEPLVSLGDLTRMIARAEISPDDEISRTGQAWKKLGEIAELQSFFANPKRAQAALSATPPLGLESPVSGTRSSRPPPRLSDAPLPIGVGSSPPAPRPEPTATGREISSPSIRVLETPPSAPATPRPSGRPAPPKTIEPARAELPKPTLTVDEPPSADHTPHERPSARTRAKARKNNEAAGRSSIPPTPSVPPAPPAGASLPPTAPSPRASAPPRATPPATPPTPPPRTPTLETQPVTVQSGLPWGRILLLIALVGLGMGAYAWGRQFLVITRPTKATPAKVFIARGDESLALHDVRRFSDAVTDYTKALAFNENDASVLTRLSRAHAVWAEALENLAQWDPVRALDARVERKRQVQAARRQAELALHAKPGDIEAEVAMADALRLDGAINAARARLTRVMEPSARAGAETLRVAALLAAAESDGDLTQALQLATRAADSDPGLIRAQLLLAKLMLSSGDTPSARERVREVLAKHPAHKLAGLLLSVIEAKAISDSTTPLATTDAATATDAQAKDAGTPAPTSETTTSGTARPTSELPNTYEELIRRGESLLERGAIKTAKEAFEKALTLRPGAAPALTGLGYIALERSDAAGAVRLFTPASNAGFGDAFIGLGDAYRQLGRHAEALRAYESYLNRFPSGPRSSIARRQTERLRELVGGGGNIPAARPVTTPSGLPVLNDVGETP